MLTIGMEESTLFDINNNNNNPNNDSAISKNINGNNDIEFVNTFQNLNLNDDKNNNNNTNALLPHHNHSSRHNNNDNDAQNTQQNDTNNPKYSKHEQIKKNILRV